MTEQIPEDVMRVLQRFITEVEDGVEILVYVKPESRFTGFRVEVGDLVFYTTEPSVAGRDNASLVNHLSRLLGISPSLIEIVEGVRERTKRVRVKGKGFTEIAEAIAKDALAHAHELA